MRNIGQIIKEERHKKGIKQISLAKGICSVSYLSRIENNTIAANEEIITLLIKKLNIKLKELTNEEEVAFIKKMFFIYKVAILERDRNQINTFKEEYSWKNINFSDSENFYNYKLYMFRLLLMTNVSDVNVSKELLFIKSLEDNFNLRQRFIYNLNLGLYFYLKGNYNKALSNLESSLDFLNEVVVEEWELADYQNALSVSYLRTNDYFNTIKYTVQTLKYYKDHLLFDRAIDSYITLGIAQQKLLDYDSAEESFKLSQQLVESIRVPGYTGIISQNLGALYAAQGKHEKAIRNYTRGLKFNKRDKRILGSLVAFLCIIKEYFKQDNFQQVIKWSQEGLFFLEENKTFISKTQYFSYFHHFDIYNARSNSNAEVIQKLLEAITHFEKIEDTRYIQKYSIVLADFYFKESKYKAAGLYYQKSSEITLKQKSVLSVEDL